MSDPLRRPHMSQPVHFEGAWTNGEKEQVRRAVDAAEARGLPAIPSEAGAPWVATKHVFSSFTLLTASRLRFWSVFTAQSAQDLAAQIEAARRIRNGVGDGDTIFQLVYRSKTPSEMSASSLRDLLQQARPKNETSDITGVLLYKAKRFIQVLEGEEKAVRTLYATIKNDPRHIEVETLLTTHVKHRVFPGWTMELEDLDAAELGDEPGARSFLQGGASQLDAALIPEIALALERFKER